MKVIAITVIGLGLVTATAAVRTTRPASNPSREPSLKEVRAATERFHDVKVALAEGYIRDPGNICDAAEMMGKPKELGVMGVHYFRPDLLGITGPPNPRVNGTGTHTDFNKPAILIYEPQADSSLQLVAVENLVFVRRGGCRQFSATDLPGREVRHDGRRPEDQVDEAHMFEPHYDRHVWIYRDNPNGVFAQFNPNATCKWHRGGEHKH